MKKENLWFGLILAVVLLFTYQPAWYGRPIMDDLTHLPSPNDRSMAGLKDIWFSPPLTQQYHPLVDTVFWLEARISSASTLTFHLGNIALHWIAAILLLLLFQRLRIPGAWLGAAIFALHPVQVESVAFLVELKNTLSAVFLFAAMLAYLRFDESRERKWYWLAAALVLIGLFAKAVTGYLPVFVLLLLWWKRGRLEWRRDVRPLLPFFALGIVAAIGTSWMEREFSEARGPGFEFTPVERFLIAGRAFWFYLAKIFWPNDLMLIYPRWDIQPGAWWQYLYPAAAIIACAVIWFLRRSYRWLWTALVFFLATLIPFIGFFNFRLLRWQFVSDHFQYLPLLAVAVPFAAGVSVLLDHWRGMAKIVTRGAVLLLLLVLAGLSRQHSAAFANSETCYKDVLKKNPTAWPAYANLGTMFVKQGRPAEAEANLRKVLELNPSDPRALGIVYLYLGYVEMAKGNLTAAMNQFEKSIALAPDFKAYSAIGTIQHQQGKVTEALASYQKALELQPDSPVAQANIAWILATARDPSLRDGARAVHLASRANEISGGQEPLILHTLAAAYAEKGDFGDAIKTARLAIGYAREKGQRALVDQLRDEIGLYEVGLPCRESVN